MKNKFLKLLSILSLCLVLNFVTNEAQAQCPMCKMSAESNLKNGGTQGQGLNQGILYMLSTPYLLVLGLGAFWYYNKKKKGEEDLEEVS